MGINQQIILGMLRHALTIAAGGMVTAGWVDGETATQLVGGVFATVGLGWSYLDKRGRG